MGQLLRRHRSPFHPYLAVSPTSLADVDMRKRQILYQIIGLVAVMGIIVSLLFEPGTVLPQITLYTILTTLLLFCAEYLWLRQTALLKNEQIGTKWVITRVAFLAVSSIPQVVCLFIAAFIWFAMLPVLLILTMILLYKFLKLSGQKHSSTAKLKGRSI